MSPDMSSDSPDIDTGTGSAASVEAIVLDILAETLDESVDDLCRQRVLAEYDWDSITMLLTLAQLESRFGITVDLRSYHATRTVDDIIDLVSDNHPNHPHHPHHPNLTKEHR
jgi:acyl carrier protein